MNEGVTFEQIMQLISNHGVSLVLVLYYIYKDYKTTGQIIQTLTELKEVMIEIRTWHNSKEGKS